MAVVLKLTAGGDAGKDTASNPAIDGEGLVGDARFGTAEMGRDPSTLDAVNGVQGELGKFGLQARGAEVPEVRSHAWSRDRRELPAQGHEGRCEHRRHEVLPRGGGRLVEGWALPGADQDRGVPRVVAVAIAGAGV
ncbi:DUF6230 family protein [Streptomyces sp. NBC_01361]|uniref:DUF6230 family protein n=1 Tax=Streptomyces sp. NBC_01361 TaxID=2903838 RepID=UPI002E303CE0|nr:DUF6230 family protein [Streptomyces sp. NBC_01361]